MEMSVLNPVQSGRSRVVSLHCPVNFNLTLQRLLQWFVHFLPTYNHQIQQWFATLPLLQLGLDVDRLLALSRGAAWGRSGQGLFPV